ncbi:hypothetical protein ABK040_006901 [Willaertia magna]
MSNNNNTSSSQQQEPNNNNIVNNTNTHHLHYSPTTSIVPFEQFNFWRIESIHNPIYHVHEDHEDHLYNREKHNYLKHYRFHKGGTIHSKYEQIVQKLPDGPLTKENQPKIEISESEKKVFNFLIEVNNYFKLGTTLRVAGGWVRNKLLGLDGDDIDIALDNLMGAEFAEYVTKYQKIKNLPSKAIGIINANPEQSKHLETATTHIFGQSIDLVNLRSEEYAEESRIPTKMSLGTPEQDARRRDLTINSLFYNINEDIIEDFTGKGIFDLKHCIIRTPLPPVQTFLDDPLRVLRSIRFACHFDFCIADELMDAAHNYEVDKALGEKVSRERVGIEIMKMVKGNDPVGAFALIGEMKIKHVVFTLTTSTEKKKRELISKVYDNPIPLEWKDDLMWENSLYRMRIMFKLAKKCELNAEDRAELLLAGFLSALTTEDMTKDEIQTLVENLICSSFRLPLKLSNNITTIIYGAQQIKYNVLVCDEKKESLDEEFFTHLIQENRLLIGKWIRNDVKTLYDRTLLLCNVINTVGTEFTEKRCYRAEKFLSALKKQHVGLLKLSQSSPVLNGSDISKALSINPGPIVAKVLEELVDYSLEKYPQVVTKEEALEWLKEHSERFLKLHAELETYNPKKKQKK